MKCSSFRFWPMHCSRDRKGALYVNIQRPIVNSTASCVSSVKEPDQSNCSRMEEDWIKKIILPKWIARAFLKTKKTKKLRLILVDNLFDDITIIN